MLEAMDYKMLKQTVRKGGSLKSVCAKALWEIKGMDVRARWLCNSSTHHSDFWATPREILTHEENKDSACPFCRELAQEDVVERAEFLRAKALHDARVKKSMQKAKSGMRRAASMRHSELA